MATTETLPETARFPRPDIPPRPTRQINPGRAARSTYSGIAQAADLVVLAFRALVAALTPPYDWRADFIDESWRMVKKTLVPVAATCFAVGYANGVVQAGQLLGILGAPDRIGGFFVMVSIRELSVWVTSMVLAGIVGSAICADLGARKVRNELDALAVMGVDPVRSIVVPRLLALSVFTTLLTVVGAWFGLLGGLAGQVFLLNEPASSFFGTLWANLTLADVVGFVAKTLVVGFVIGLVNCYKGMSASGGPEGVGRAVNQAVVISFTVIWAFQFLFTATFLAAFPESLDFH